MSNLIVEYSVIYSLRVDGFQYKRRTATHALAEKPASIDDLYQKAEGIICKVEDVSVEHIKILGLMRIG